MTCDKCGQPPVTFIRYSGQHLCKEHFIRFFEKRAKTELVKQGKLPEGTVAVALSGGKDSVAALWLLSKIVASNPRINLVAVSVDEGIAGYRQGSLEICKEFTQKLAIPWKLIETKILAGYTIDDYAQGKLGPSADSVKRLRVAPADGTPRAACGPCGVFRRVGVNRLAQEVDAAAVVTGHNLDDMAQTLLMNHLQGDIERLARLAPHDNEQDGLVPRLIPFRTIPEKEVLLYALLEGLPIHHEEECPYAARANRFMMRDILLDIEGKQPGTRHSLLKGQERLKPLLGKMPRQQIHTCACGEATSGITCRACEWKA